MNIPHVSMYSNATDTQGVADQNLMSILQAIQNGKWEPQVQAIRSEKDPKKRRQLKTSLPGFTASGSFGTRKDSELLSHSGLIALDFDGVKETRELMLLLQKMPQCFAAWRSVSGKGVCALIRIPGGKRGEKDHQAYFYALSEHFANQGYTADPTGKNISRLRFISSDPALHLNPDAQVWEQKLNHRSAPIKKLPSLLHTDDDIQHIISQINANNLDITGNYPQWLDILFAIESKYGETGEGFHVAHTVSCNSGLYDSDKTERQYRECCRHKGHGITIATFFYYAKQAGVSIRTDRTRYLIAGAKTGAGQRSDLESVKSNLKTTKEIETTKEEDALIQTILDNPDRFGGAKDDGDEIPAIEQLEMFVIGSYDLRFNDVTKKVELDETPIEDRQVNSMYVAAKKAVKKGVTKADVDSLLHSDSVKAVNPIKEFVDQNIESYNLDSALVKRFIQCLPYTDGNYDNLEYRLLFFEKWYLGMIGAIYGDHNELCLTLVGRQHGTGKTKFFRELLPKQLTAYYQDGVLPQNESDRIRIFSSNLLVLLDEFTTSRSIEEVKAMLSAQRYNNRRAYGRHDKEEVRLASFGATSNHEDFLNDSTGNRRFVPFILNAPIDFDQLDTIDRTALFMHFVQRYRDGERGYLDHAQIELLGQLTEHSQQGSIELDLIPQYFEVTETDPNSEVYNKGEILAHLQYMERGLKLDYSQISKSLQKLGASYRVWRCNDSTKKGYRLRKKSIMHQERDM